MSSAWCAVAGISLARASRTGDGMRGTVALAVASAVFLLGPPSVGADVSGGSSVNQDGNTSTHVKHETSAPGASGPHNSGTSTPLASYVTYETLGDGPAKTGDLTGLCFVGNDTTKPGFQYR